MKIKEIEIKNFGKFSNQRFVFRDGIQVFYGENEFGKSTIYGFLKAMLFGMERGRGKAAHNRSAGLNRGRIRMNTPERCGFPVVRRPFV